MQIIQLTLNIDFNFYCPISGLPIIEDGVINNVPSFKGLFVFESQECLPTFNDNEMEQAWCDLFDDSESEDYDEQENNTADEEDVCSFLANYEKENWVAFRVTTNGPYAHTTETTYLVIDMSAQNDMKE